MTALSKELFYKNGTNYTCKTFHTWSKSCMKASLILVPHAVVGCLQFFLPIYVIQTILNRNKINREYLIESFKGYLRRFSFGFFYLFTFITSNCIISNIFGGISYYSMGVLCGFLCGLAVFIETQENINLDTLYFFNLITEAIVKNGQYYGYFKLTKLSMTLWFMLSSGLLSYLMKKQKEKPYNNIWFHSPKQYKMDMGKCEDNACVHKQSCERHVFDGFYKYFIGGYLVEIVKYLLTHFGLLMKKPKTIGNMLFNKNNVLFGFVTGGYVALYRIITCYFTKKDKSERNYHHLLAGVFSGVTFYIKPNLQFACVAFTTFIQLLLQRVQKKTQLSEKWNGILFSLINGILLHNRFMLPKTCPKYVVNFISICSNGMDKHVLDVMDLIRQGARV